MTTPTPAPKRLTRSTTDKWLGGVCGGLAQYTGVDANLIRLITVVLVVVGVGTTLLVYLAAWLLMPQAQEPSPWTPPTTDGPPAPQPPSA
ncbi:PspC domain-containing protein [Aeromicrobium duanguangcaii]|uniref:PspC domain-containing protein n=1 Tax=Aeromicrobium duanguangcaii TaxID=2968086 RepID=A0ABY5KCM4_9ACTN|nr:PspC domain-containing protein [Aeromicrobium duanguangcaii]MCD9155274.1 PspC domain-containing protein [Aeromicrobium duanguangcaii]MCL3838625.1 PspC domain-containing protein [Aeromicrobium duanguangcaii]UUI68075.1 PspC domain-containing protein [Aeromicrobium duanguangcaii]